MKDLAGWMKEADDLKEVTKIGRNPVNRRDLMTILPGKINKTPWANDNAMNAFLAALCTKANEIYRQTRRNDPGFDEIVPRYHAFNTQWFPKMKKEGYGSIKNWAMRAKLGGTNLLKCARVIIPVFDLDHWTLLVISPQRRAVQFYNSLARHGSRDTYLNSAVDFLQGELKGAFNETEWTFTEEMSGQQANSCDCGIFTCCNAVATFYADLPIELVPDGEMQEARYFFAGVLANGGFKDDMALDKLHSGFTLD
jgi:Ulp1 family protease